MKFKIWLVVVALFLSGCALVDGLVGDLPTPTPATITNVIAAQTVLEVTPLPTSEIATAVPTVIATSTQEIVVDDPRIYIEGTNPTSCPVNPTAVRAALLDLPNQLEAVLPGELTWNRSVLESIPIYVTFHEHASSIAWLETDNLLSLQPNWARVNLSVSNTISCMALDRIITHELAHLVARMGGDANGRYYYGVFYTPDATGHIQDQPGSPIALITDNFGVTYEYFITR